MRLGEVGAYLFIWMLGFTGTFTVQLVGSLPVAEIIVIMIAPVLILLQRRRIFKPGFLIIYCLMGLWLLGQIITDIYRQTPTLDWMRGVAAITFFGLDLACISALLQGSSSRKVVFFFGYAVGSMVSSQLQSEEAYDFWKFGISYGTMMIAILISCYFYRKRQYVIAGLIIGANILPNLFFNYRSPILFILVVMALVLPMIPERVLRFRLLPRPGTAARTAVLAGIVLSTSLLSERLVHWATVRGLAGEEAQEKNLMQEQLKGGMLLNARPEILVSSLAVKDSPILGHGSWAKDYRYVELLNDMQIENGISPGSLYGGSEEWNGIIPAHSHLMGSWVWAGILGAIFWVYVFWLVARGIVVVSNTLPPLAPFYAWLLVWYAWAIPFSPFGSIDRLQEGAVLVILVDLLEKSKYALRKPQWLQKRPLRRPPRRGRPLIIERKGRGGRGVVQAAS
jgi:hypothetical protein